MRRDQIFDAGFPDDVTLVTLEGLELDDVAEVDLERCNGCS